jgi:hypothetical protein
MATFGRFAISWSTRGVGCRAAESSSRHAQSGASIPVIRYMVVDTRNWLPGKKVLIAPSWISRVSWADSRVYVDVLRGRIEGAPEYDPSRPLVREHEARLYEHYGRRKYWEDENKIVS